MRSFFTQAKDTLYSLAIALMDLFDKIKRGNDFFVPRLVIYVGWNRRIGFFGSEIYTIFDGILHYHQAHNKLGYGRVQNLDYCRLSLKERKRLEQASGLFLWLLLCQLSYPPPLREADWDLNPGPAA